MSEWGLFSNYDGDYTEVRAVEAGFLSEHSARDARRERYPDEDYLEIHLIEEGESEPFIGDPTMEKSMSDLVEEYTDHNRMYSWENQRGMENLTKLVKALGYKGHGFQYGEPIEAFLHDNPGAIEALVSWISDHDIPEWMENLESELPADEDGEGGE